MPDTMQIGIIGCGNISDAYLRLAGNFNGIEVVACADLNTDAATTRAGKYGVRALTVDALLTDGGINMVVNLTPPVAHFNVSKAILNAGKHVYSEKPFVLSLDDGQTLLSLATAKGLRIGSAPDTFLGGAHQHARHLIDSGKLGRITNGTAHVMNRGMEHWHPDPDFFFKKGAGPVLDIGPYYLANLIQLIGPVSRVMAMATLAQTHRIIGSEPRAGEKIGVETPTTVHSLLEFESGAVITLGTSWDVQHHGHSSMQLYGERGTLYVPDPNFFGGDVAMTDGDEPIDSLPPFDHPLSNINEVEEDGKPVANYRCVGLADMANAIRTNTPHRCSADMALHTVDVMLSILESSETGASVTLSTRCERPQALTPSDAQSLLATP